MEDFIENLSTLSSSSSTFLQEAVRQKKLRLFCTNTTKTLKLFPKMGIFAIDHHIAAQAQNVIHYELKDGLEKLNKNAHIISIEETIKTFQISRFFQVGRCKDIFRIKCRNNFDEKKY